MKESPFIAVLKRELDRMVSRRIYFAYVYRLAFCSLSSLWLQFLERTDGESACGYCGW